MNHISLPYHIYVNVSNKFLGPNMPPGVTKAIWHGIHSREGQILMCHLLLETGAHWSGMPLHGLSETNDFSIHQHILMPWGCMGKEISATKLAYLEGLSVHYFKENLFGKHTGIIIDWMDGFSRYPQEHKPLSLLALDKGQFALVPNNYFTMSDSHFVNDEKKDETKLYLRNEIVFWEK